MDGWLILHLILKSHGFIELSPGLEGRILLLAKQESVKDGVISYLKLLDVRQGSGILLPRDRKVHG